MYNIYVVYSCISGFGVVGVSLLQCCVVFDRKKHSQKAHFPNYIVSTVILCRDCKYLNQVVLRDNNCFHKYHDDENRV